jgi:phosphoribosyl-AMP cyclohydrolase
LNTQTSLSHQELEEGAQLAVDFTKLQQICQTGAEVVPVAVQDADSKELLIIAYANDLALQYSLEHGVATFWSTSRNELWIKGATSGDTLDLIEVRVNCEQNSLLYLVRPRGDGACHTKDTAGIARSSCYYRRLTDGQLEIVEAQA